MLAVDDALETEGGIVRIKCAEDEQLADRELLRNSSGDELKVQHQDDEVNKPDLTCALREPVGLNS